MISRRGAQLLVAGVSLAALLAACAGGDETTSAAPVIGDPGPVHVHAVGINPSDEALFIATHTGLFRAPEGETQATRVADRFQDTMGFTVIGPDQFLGSGHPDGREDLPPFLGLIKSTDAGETWQPVSLLAERDFHVLEAQGSRIYGFGSDFDTQELALLVSDDRGETWSRRSPPEPLIALAIDPEEPDHVIASVTRRLYESDDAGRRWRPLEGNAGLIAWPASERLYLVDAEGAVRSSNDSGSSWRSLGDAGGGPAAFEAAATDELYVALHDGTVKRSSDGVSWTIRSAP